jgi:amino acid transporter
MNEGQQALKDLGYKQELDRSVTSIGHLALILSDITPTASLLVVGTAVIAVAGTGSIWSYLIGCFIALNVALCMGELGSMFPVAGGLFSIVTRVLGRPIGFVAMVDYMGQAVFLPASVAIGIGTYVNALFPQFPTNIVSGLFMIAVTLVCLLRINTNAWLTGIFLLIELLIVAALAFAGFSHWHQPLSILTNPVGPGPNGTLAPVATAAIVAAIATALFSVNGYDAGINFAEEVLGSAAQVGKAVFLAATLGILFELIPFIGIVFGAPSLKDFVNSPTPLTTVAQDIYGSGFGTVITVGALIAIFNATIAITLQFARIVWASGRDMAWPEPVSSWIARVIPGRGTPWVATLIVGALATILCFQSTLVAVVTFTAVLIIVLYGLIAISALVSRIRQKDLPRPWRMPAWPVPPIIALVGVVIALTQQKASDLLGIGGLFLVAVIYYYVFIRPRSDRYWNIANAAAEHPSR